MSEKHERCKTCANRGHCQLGTHDYIKPLLDLGCDRYRPEHKPTNGDRIRAMSNEELSIWHEKACPPGDYYAKCTGVVDCVDCWKGYLDREEEQ